MAGLIPTELHRYSIGDISRGLIAARKRVESQTVIHLPGLGDGIPIRSARAAVIVALKALGMPPGSRIGVPLYCCPVVFKAIKAAGCVPRFLDIDTETFCLSPKDLQTKRSGIDALIAVHMFGNLCDMPKILEIIAGKPIIEDCAQSLGSKLAGRASGSFGNISVFSFRSGKYLSTGEGGALFSKNKELLSSLSIMTSSLPVPNLREEVVYVLKTYIKSALRSRRMWGWLGSKFWSVYNKRTDFIDKSPIISGRIYASNFEIILRRMPHLDSMIANQRTHAIYYENNLLLDPQMICKEPPGFYFNRFMYPIIFPSTLLKNMIASHLRRHGIDSSTPYEEAITGAAINYDYKGDCPIAESLLERTLVIPSYYKLGASEVKYIARQVNEAWTSSSARMPSRD